MNKAQRSVGLVLMGAIIAGSGPGCSQGDQIPLADVPPAPPIDPSQKKSAKKPPGGSPDVLVYPSS